ncbi:HET-domain-containing protein [Lentithecium fluviatile CBS 122367]|uniref:HET-domain-containing protein n=1 Tax=Lentithecium fluviatile CBS 122367 TaxID=1168545 RepID=A0A6G1ISE1_9PLEO|nr:HET-domain-containing protein [Lentithecium fluviatile CBS 122367]
MSEKMSDVETFCKECMTVLSRLETGGDDLHENVLRVIECGKRCRFCRFVATSFGVDYLRELAETSEKNTVPYIYARVDQLEVGEDKFVSHADLDLRIYRVKTEARFKEQGTLEASKSFMMLGNSAKGLHRAMWSSAEPITFEARKPLLVNWLEECRTSHPKCRNTLSTDTPLAARILEIQVGCGEPRLRLMPTDNLDLHHTPYTVLSHCWGNVEIECKTTVDKLNSYHDSIDLGSLPKTFREALDIATTLGFRYLWIDSLCIVQDDSADWQRESAKMQYIFRAATLTISASSARNSTEGCGLSTVFPPAVRFTTPATAQGNRPAFFALREGLRGPLGTRNNYKGFKDFPVHKRAWIFQEKTLSRRILHAAHPLFFWQCTTYADDEDGFIDSNPRDAGIPMLASQVPEYVRGPRERWVDWSHEYASRKLTYASDNYAAFAGATALYQELTGDEPVLGLWKKDLVRHLAWDAWASPMEWHPLEEVRCPSWTWMSYPHGRINFHNWQHFDYREDAKKPILRYEASVLSVSVGWTGQPLVSSPLPSSSIKLNGLVDTFQPPEPRPPRLGYKGRTHWDPDFLLRGFPKETDQYGRYFDVLALFAREEETTYYTHLGPRIEVVELILVSVPGRGRNVFRRVGTVERQYRMKHGERVKEHLPGVYRDVTLI